MIIQSLTAAPIVLQLELPPGYLAAVKLLAHHWGLTEIGLLLRILDEAESNGTSPEAIGAIDRSGWQVWRLVVEAETVARLDRLAADAGADRAYYLCMVLQQMVADAGKSFPHGMPAGEARLHFEAWGLRA